MKTFTNSTGVPKAVITVDGPIILKGGETSKDVSKYKFTDDYVNLLAAAGVTYSDEDSGEETKSADKRTKDELIARANELGTKIDAKAKRGDILALVLIAEAGIED